MTPILLVILLSPLQKKNLMLCLLTNAQNLIPKFTPTLRPGKGKVRLLCTKEIEHKFHKISFKSMSSFPSSTLSAWTPVGLCQTHWTQPFR